MDHLVKTNDSSIAYDPNSGALLNTDDNALLRFKSERSRALKLMQMEEQIAQLMARVAALEEKS